MDDFVKKIRTNTALAVLARYGLAIAGAVVVTAGIAEQDQVDTVIRSLNDITNGALVIAGGISTIAPVLFALWKAWFKPALPVKDMAPSVAEKAVTSVQSTKEARKQSRTILDIFKGR